MKIKVYEEAMRKPATKDILLWIYRHNVIPLTLGQMFIKKGWIPDYKTNSTQTPRLNTHAQVGVGYRSAIANTKALNDEFLLVVYSQQQRKIEKKPATANGEHEATKVSSEYLMVEFEYTHWNN